MKRMKKKVHSKLSPIARRSILSILDKLQETTPKKVYSINLLNTGFVVNTKQARDRILELIKKII